ncbi:AMP-binding protein [Archangium minus]|uniref:AMP-binding protein n=1 Tax=Archangium minus TaxID=83450 RepID=A0ABY9WS26_9BACT|nr:AMP-binding protein [Archangium minus]
MAEKFGNAAARVNGSAYRQKGWWRDETVVDDLFRAIKNHPDKAAIVAARYFARDVTRISYAELGMYMDRFAGALRELGVGREQIVAVQLPNWWQFTAIALACARIGAVLAPIPPDYRRREVEFILSRTEAPVYIGPASWTGFSHRAMLREMAPALPSLRHRIFLGAGGGLAEGELDFDAWLVSNRWEERYPAHALDELTARADDVFNVLYTSGTTGEPKGVVHSYNTNYAITRALNETMELGADDVISLPSLLTASSGFTYLFQMPVLLGATAVYLDVADPEFHLALIEEHGISFMYGIPTYYLNMLAAQKRRPRKMTTLKCLATGSTPVPPHLIAEVRDGFGVRLHTLWGMTENGAVTITRHEDPPDWPANSDGAPVPWMEVKIAPATAEDGSPFPDGAGRLLVRGASQCLGYFKCEDTYNACLDAEGWFDTGDLARDDGRGGIRIAGRLKDIIFRHGLKIPVVEVESALYAHPKVREVAVVAHADDRIGGERVCAVVVPREEAPSLKELREHLRKAGMSVSYWPDRLEIISEMPKTPSGKIRKFLLRERLKETSGSTP